MEGLQFLIFSLLWFCFVFCVFVLFCYSNHPERWEAVAYCGLFCFETGAGLLCLLVLGPKGCSTSHSLHCGFHLHFLANQQCWESLYVIVGEMPTLEMRLCVTVRWLTQAQRTPLQPCLLCPAELLHLLWSHLSHFAFIPCASVTVKKCPA